MIARFMSKYCIGMQYADLVRIVLNNTRAVLRMCVRESVKGCKRNPRKLDKEVRDIFHRFANLDEKQLIEFITLQDDEPENVEPSKSED